jgi:hypothetical protein
MPDMTAKQEYEAALATYRDTKRACDDASSKLKQCRDVYAKQLGRIKHKSVSEMRYVIAIFEQEWKLNAK